MRETEYNGHRRLAATGPAGHDRAGWRHLKVNRKFTDRNPVLFIKYDTARWTQPEPVPGEPIERGNKSMKSLEELQALRDQMKDQMGIRHDAKDNIRVVVGMATCGIAAGARPVLQRLTEEVAKRGLKNVTVTQTGCIGICQYEPVVEVFENGKEKVTYVKMTEDKIVQVVAEHLVNGHPIAEYTIGAAQAEAKD